MTTRRKATGKKPAEPRSATAVRFKPDLYERLVAASEDHGRSINWLVNEAVADYLDRLLPASEVKLTKD